jgi:hypothetical protein
MLVPQRSYLVPLFREMRRISNSIIAEDVMKHTALITVMSIEKSSVPYILRRSHAIDKVPNPSMAKNDITWTLSEAGKEKWYLPDCGIDEGACRSAPSFLERSRSQAVRYRTCLYFRTASLNANLGIRQIDTGWRPGPPKTWLRRCCMHTNLTNRKCQDGFALRGLNGDMRCGARNSVIGDGGREDA